MRDVIDIPVLRTAPPELAHRIDAVERGARLLYAGDGRWRLWRLVQDPNEASKTRLGGIKLLDGMLALDGLRGGKGRVAGAVTTALMALRGYRWEWDYRVQGEPNTSIVDDFVIRLWWERTVPELERERIMMDIASGDDRMRERIKRGVDYVTLEGTSRHRWAFKKPVSIINAGGCNGAAG